MNTFTTPRHDEELDAYPDETTQELPRRPRRQFLTWRSAGLVALVTCAVGFYAGIRLEKGQLAASGTSGSSRAATGRLGARGGATGGSRAGLASLFSGAGVPGGAAGDASFGTVSSVHGKTLYLTEASGNTVTVKLSSATKVSKTQSASRSAIRPGDTVVVQGIGGSNGTVTAASVTDSGTRSTGAAGGGGAGSSGGSTSAGPGGTSSAVGSLFSSGG